MRALTDPLTILRRISFKDGHCQWNNVFCKLIETGHKVSFIKVELKLDSYRLFEMKLRLETHL